MNTEENGFLRMLSVIKQSAAAPNPPWKILALSLSSTIGEEEGVTQIILRDFSSNKGYVAIMARKKRSGRV